MLLISSELKDNHDSNALRACEELGLDPEMYAKTFEQISMEWERALGTSTYLAPFVGSFLLTICKTPQDFIEASKIILESYKGVYELQDGSWDFGQVVMEELKSGRIKSMDDLKAACTKLTTENHTFRTSEAGQNPLARNGTQFHRFISEVRAQLEHV